MDRETMSPRFVSAALGSLLVLAVACTMALAGGSGISRVEVGMRGDWPGYAALARGPWRVRLDPRTRTPAMIFCTYHAGDDVTCDAIRKSEVGDAWFSGVCDTTLKAMAPYYATGQPMMLYFDEGALWGGQPDSMAYADALMAQAEKEHPGQTLPLGVGEWENGLWTWWDPVHALAQRETIFGITPQEAGTLDRRGLYERVLTTHRRWREKLHGRITSMAGYGLLSHLAADAGSEMVGIETGETIPATQVKRAFVRGAARQYGIPWFEDISPWFGPSICVGRPEGPTTTSDGTYVGPNAGHSVSMMMRLWTTAWFSGAAMLSMEGSESYFFDVPRQAEHYPPGARLSPFGEAARRLFRLMKREEIGVPWTPFGVLVDKYHGRWSVWGKPWGCLDETPGDHMMVRFFDALYPGQSQGAGREERYLCPSPYGDSFDVLVTDGPRAAWAAYPVLLGVGDIGWADADIAALLAYVRSGGILALNERNVAGWDRSALGLAKDRFAPAPGAVAVLSSPGGEPLLLRHQIGKGYVFVAAARPEPGVGEERAFPAALLKALARTFLPFTVTGHVETLVNRTADGWALLVVNNSGIRKAFTEAPVTDATRTAHVTVAFRGRRPVVRDLLSDRPPAWLAGGRGLLPALAFDLAPGEMRLLKVSAAK